MDKEELDVKKLREELELTQGHFAKLLGITERTLRDIENTGEYSEAIKFRMLRFAKTKEKDCMLDGTIDYLRMQFKTHDFEPVISEVLMLSVEYMVQQDTRFYGYKGLYALDMIKVLYSEVGDSRGTLIELSGQGCRQFETMLQAQGRTWFSFLDCCAEHGGRATRLDLAINDYVKLLQIPRLLRKIKNGECITRFMTFDNRNGGRFSDGQSEGTTIYFGSQKSDFYLCFYEKDYEQAKKLNIPREYVEIKNRYELRLKDERARNAMAYLRNKQSLKDIALAVLGGHIRFVNKGKTKDKNKWKTNKDWENFLGEVGKIKLVVEPSEFFYTRTREWLRNYCMPTVKMVKTVDRLMERSDFNQMLKETDLSDKHVKLIKVLTATKEDMITDGNI